jgi:hypothetical protein
MLHLEGEHRPQDQPDVVSHSAPLARPVSLKEAGPVRNGLKAANGGLNSIRGLPVLGILNPTALR